MAVGKVYLVGAGPGDPGLLTLKGRACLEQADLVLYDGLVNPSILRHSPAIAERTSRVNGPNGKKLNQEHINQRLVEAGLAGKTVVRLKGGDPYIFGRGTEEAEALRAAGVPFEVVPGVTAATAAGEYAGVSVTHRKLASAVAFVTGHEDPSKPATLAYAALAAFPGTLVFYMGLARIEAIAGSLVEHGKDPDTPACVVSRASRARQRTVPGELSNIATRVHEAGLSAPSLIIIGECAIQHETLQWFEQQPLFGKRIAVTRAAAQAEPTVQTIHQLGGEAVLMPLIQASPPRDWNAVDATIDGLSKFEWLAFTSANGVRFFFERMHARGFDGRKLGSTRIAAVGRSTADALREFHVHADLVPNTQNAEGLAQAMLDAGVSGSVLWLRGDRGRDTLSDLLGAAGVEVVQSETYVSADVSLSESGQSDLRSGDVDWICLASPAMAANLAATVEVSDKVNIAAISPLTSQAARDAGLRVDVEATDYSWAGMIQAIVDRECR